MIKWGICCLQNPKWFPKHCATWWKEKSDTVTILYLGRNISHVTKYCVHTCSVMSNSLILCLWDFPCKNTGVGCYFLLQNIFLMQRLNPGLLCLLNCRWILYHWATGKPTSSLGWQKKKKKGTRMGILWPWVCLFQLCIPKLIPWSSLLLEGELKWENWWRKGASLVAQQ